MSDAPKFWLALASGTIASHAGAVERPNPPSQICVLQTCSPEEGMSELTARSAAAFVDSIGVNTHFTNYGTSYVTEYAWVKSRLLALGVTHIRDGAHDVKGTFVSSDNAAAFRDLGNAGIRATFIFNANVSREFVQGFPERVRPAFEAYEFPNELNANPSIEWRATLRDWAPKFRTYIRSSPGTAQYPIVGPSLIDSSENAWATLGDLSAYLDYGNVHAYYSSRDPATLGWGAAGTPPCESWRYGSRDYKLCNVRRVSAAKPIISTETGWGTDLSRKGQVPESVQAKYIVRGLLLHFDAGVRRTFIYQLVDAGTDGFGAYGMLTASGSEKASYKALSGLLDLLEDARTVAQPEPLRVSIMGDAPALRAMLFQKSDGTFRLILWTEKPAFDPLAAAPIAVSPSQIRLRLVDSGMTITALHAFQDAGTATHSRPARAATGDYSLTVTDNLTVAEIQRTQ